MANSMLVQTTAGAFVGGKSPGRVWLECVNGTGAEFEPGDLVWFDTTQSATADNHEEGSETSIYAVVRPPATIQAQLKYGFGAIYLGQMDEPISGGSKNCPANGRGRFLLTGITYAKAENNNNAIATVGAPITANQVNAGFDSVQAHTASFTQGAKYLGFLRETMAATPDGTPVSTLMFFNGEGIGNFAS